VGTAGWKSIGFTSSGATAIFIGFEALVCADDAEAIEKAKRLADRYAIELWSGARFVTRLEYRAVR
jgi:hypothetical protein